MKQSSVLTLAAAMLIGYFQSAAAKGSYAQLDDAARGSASQNVNVSSNFPEPVLPLLSKISDPAVSYTAAQARRLAAMAAADPVQVNFVNGGMDAQDQYYYWGVPRIVTQVPPAKVGIMRHWTSNAQAGGVPVVALIVKSGQLKAGPRPYIIPVSHRADYYSDLHGVFFTTPDFDPALLWMGLRPDSDYVDFVVNPAMGALYLAPGNYLFPCPMNIKQWILDEYLKWKNTGVMPGGMEFTFKQIDRDGGPQNAIDIPITVARYQQNGKVTVLRPDLLKKPY